MTPSHKVEAWGRLLRAAQGLQAEIEADLKAAGFPPLAWYDVLLALSGAGEAGLRQFVLRDRVAMPQYTVSRLLDRMAREGLILREACPDDGRGQIVRISDPGLELLDDMWPVYRDAIGERFAQYMTEDDTLFLNALLARLRPDEGLALAPG